MKLRVIAAVALSLAAPATSEAAPTPCPTATLAEYLTTIRKCYLANVPVSGFGAAFGGTAPDGSSIRVVPLAYGPAALVSGVSSVGFRFEAIGDDWGFSFVGSGLRDAGLRFEASYRMSGTLLAIEPARLVLDATFGLRPGREPFGDWVAATEIFGGCGSRLFVDDGAFAIDPPDAVSLELTGGRSTSEGRFCEMLSPASTEFDISAGGGEAVVGDFRIRSFEASFEVDHVVTPEPATITLLGLGLGIIGLAGHRRARGRTGGPGARGRLSVAMIGWLESRRSRPA